MTIDENRLPIAGTRGYQIWEEGTVLHLKVDRDIESLSGRVDWGNAIANACGGHYQAVVVDLVDMIRATSSFISGLIHLRDALRPERFVLRNVPRRLEAVIQVLGADRLFVIEG